MPALHPIIQQDICITKRCKSWNITSAADPRKVRKRRINKFEFATDKGSGASRTTDEDKMSLKRIFFFFSDEQ